MTTRDDEQPGDRRAAAAGELDLDLDARYTGECKWFNVVKGFGFIVLDNSGEDLFVHQSQLNMSGFRSLEEGERVSFKIRVRDRGGREAYDVSAEVDGQDLRGSSIHPLGKKKEKMVRCYNCGKFGFHVASKCKEAKVDKDTKTCYKCGSPDHLFSDCPENPLLNKRGGKKDGAGTSAKTA